jgi:hypothetical protein
VLLDVTRKVTIALRRQVDRVLIIPKARAVVGDPEFDAKVTCIVEHSGVNQFKV